HHRYLLSGAVRRLPARLPRSVDLRRGCSPVEDQGQLGSCTGNALAGAVEFLEKRDGIPLVNVSRLFIYYNERVIEHTVADDAGAMIRDGIKTLVKQGTCSEKRWPYVIARFAVKPSAACYDEGTRRCPVRSAWGTGWGRKGYFTMPYDYLASRDLSDDFWTIRRQEGF